MAREVDPDVVVLDLGLPGIDGLEVCRQLRTFSDAYVVMLTARDTEMDTIVGLSVGADDYVTKPFSPRELVARIRAMLRRPCAAAAAAVPHTAEAPPRVFGPLSIDIASRQVFLDGELIPLTRTEFDILAALASRPGVVWNRRQLIDAVWGEPWVGNDHLVDVHVGTCGANPPTTPPTLDSCSPCAGGLPDGQRRMTAPRDRPVSGCAGDCCSPRPWSSSRVESPPGWWL